MLSSALALAASARTGCEAYIHTYIHTYMHAYIHTYIHTYMHAYIHTYIHIIIGQQLPRRDRQEEERLHLGYCS